MVALVQTIQFGLYLSFFALKVAIIVNSSRKRNRIQIQEQDFSYMDFQVFFLVHTYIHTYFIILFPLAHHQPVPNSVTIKTSYVTMELPRLI
jgi:hypothetical protein